MNNKYYRNRRWLFQQYIIKQKSTTQIALICGVTKTVICRWLKRHQIRTRTIQESRQSKNLPLYKRSWLLNEYVTLEKTLAEVADVLKVSSETVRYWLKRHKIPPRKPWQHFKPKFGKENYMCNKKGFLNPFFGKSHSKKTRQKISQANRGKNTGKNNSAWRGGATCLQEKIRKSNQYLRWRSEVYKRDNYSCKICGYDKGRKINADHIKPFAVILLENNIKTLSMAYSCNELWDISNGRTLCVDCHKKTDTWGHKTTKAIQQSKNKKYILEDANMSIGNKR